MKTAPRLASSPIALFAAALALLAGPVPSQFDSGSDESDGALLVQNGDPALQIQEDGVHHYTTITVEAGATLRFLPNSLNTPVILLASGDVSILGTINISGQDGFRGIDPNAGLPGSETAPGPGGYPGGIGGATVPGIVVYGTSGGGPGGGASPFGAPQVSNLGPGGNGGSHFLGGGVGSQSNQPSAPTYGDPRLLTLSGGSGGAGGAAYSATSTPSDGPNGGAGGGAILIASSGDITVNGSINADGGDGFGVADVSWGSGAGSGGTIRLMGNVVGGSGSLFARGGGATTGVGGAGLIRIESLSLTGTLETNSTPSPVTSLPSIPSLPPGDQPVVRVVSIDGTNVMNPTGLMTTPDVTIPGTSPDPIDIVFGTDNVPDGSVINARIILTTGETVVATSAPVASDSATLSVNLPASIGIIYATADFDPAP